MNLCISETECILNRDIGGGGGRSRCEEHRWGNDRRNLHFYQGENSENSRGSSSLSLLIMITRTPAGQHAPPFHNQESHCPRMDAAALDVEIATIRVAALCLGLSHRITCFDGGPASPRKQDHPGPREFSLHARA